MSGKNNIKKWPSTRIDKSSDIWELLASVSTDLLLLVDRNYIYRAVNDSFLRVHNRSREEIVGHSVREVLGPEIFDNLVKDHLDQCLAGKQVRHQSWFNCPTLGRRFMDVSYHPFLDINGTIAGVFADIRDITDLHMAEEALRQSEERYRTVLEQMEEAYFEIDLAGNFTFFNDAMCRQLGYSREELMGMNYQAITPPENLEKASIRYNKVYAGESFKSIPMERIRKDGTRLYVESSVFPLQNERGEIIGARGIARDVTERKQSEEERRQIEQQA
jgi:two-component system cell cycle sensor histidine kinase/response regulator CckA